MVALDMLEEIGGMDANMLSHVADMVLRSKERVLQLLPLVRRLVALGARPEQAFFHELLNRCMSFGGDGVGEAIAVCDIMYHINVPFTAQTEAIAVRIREAFEEDPTFAGVEAWHLVTPDIRGVQEDEEAAEDADWITIREMTPETERVLARHGGAGAAVHALDSLRDLGMWEEGSEWTDATDATGSDSADSDDDISIFAGNRN
jgi:hypothetical protein